MVEYMSVPADSLVRGEDLSFEELVLVEPLAIGDHAVRLAAVEPGEIVLVTGCRPIGMGIMEISKIAGATVIAMDIRKERLDFCSRNATRVDFEYVTELMRKGLIKARTYITHRIPFNKVVNDFESLAKPDSGIIKAMIEL